jgi:hypothetical protein
MQDKIDRIAKWMGWERFGSERDGGDPTWYWVDIAKAERTIHERSFHPFHSPADCAVVMEHVINSGGPDHSIRYRTICGDPIKDKLYWATIERWAAKQWWPRGTGLGDSECEAKMNALLEVIGESC